MSTIVQQKGDRFACLLMCGMSPSDRKHLRDQWGYLYRSGLILDDRCRSRERDLERAIAATEQVQIRRGSPAK